MANYTNTNLFFILFASLCVALACTCKPVVAAASHITSEPNYDPCGPWAPDAPLTTVSILNALAENEVVIIHCKSHDVDLGQQVIQYGHIYQFKFRPNIQGTTLFNCNLSWSGGSKGFDAYDYARDNKRCCGKVQWSVNPRGLYCPSVKIGGRDVFLPWN